MLILEWGEQEASFLVPPGGVWGWVTCLGGWLHAQKGEKGGGLTVLNAIATCRAVQDPHFDSILLLLLFLLPVLLSILWQNI